MPLIPLIKKKLINPNDIIIDSKSGYSGAGRGVHKKYKKAISYYKKTIELRPNDAHAYNNMGIKNGQMDPNFPVINGVKDYIVAYQNNPNVETQVRQAYLSLNDRQQISPRVFNAKLRELALFSLSYDPDADPLANLNIKVE